MWFRNAAHSQFFLPLRFAQRGSCRPCLHPPLYVKPVVMLGEWGRGSTGTGRGRARPAMSPTPPAVVEASSLDGRRRYLGEGAGLLFALDLVDQGKAFDGWRRCGSSAAISREVEVQARRGGSVSDAPMRAARVGTCVSESRTGSRGFVAHAQTRLRRRPDRDGLGSAPSATSSSSSKAHPHYSRITVTPPPDTKGHQAHGPLRSGCRRSRVAWQPLFEHLFHPPHRWAVSMPMPIPPRACT